MTVATATPVGTWRPRHLSHSAIEKFVACPRNYWQSYVKKSPFVASRAMLIGSLFGKGIEEFHGDVSNGVYRGDTDLTQVVRSYRENLRANERHLVDEGAIDTVVRMLDLYRSRDGGPYDVEPEFKFSIYLPDRERVPVPILGYMDGRSKDKPFILEAKTSSWMGHPKWGYDQRRVDNSPQAALYWYHDYSQYQRDSEVRYLLMGYGDRGVTMNELTTHPNMERVESVQDDAAKLWQAILSEDFPCYDGKCKDVS